MFGSEPAVTARLLAQRHRHCERHVAHAPPAHAQLGDAHCGAIEFPPHLGCNACGYHETEWVELSGHGTLKSFVVPGIQNDKPYLKALGAYGYGAVQLDEGPIYSFVVYGGHLPKAVR